MGVSYNKLWKLLIDKGMKKKDLRDGVEMSSNTLAKLGRNEYVALDVLVRTCDYLHAHGVSCRKVGRIADGSPNILDQIESGTFDLIVNTPGHDHSHNRDGFRIRRAAAERSIPVVTAVDTAQAVIQARIMGRAKQLRAVDIAQVNGVIHRES